MIADIGKLLGGNAGAAVLAVAYVYAQFTPRTDFDAHVASVSAQAVIELRDQIKKTDDPDWKAQLCEALELELVNLCNNNPKHPFCQDREKLLKQAGCR